MTTKEKIVNDIIHKVGLMNNLTDDAVRDIINSQYKFIYETIKSVNFEGMSEEEIENSKTSFLLKYIGKILKK